ncbi:hypothetical protein HMPREF1531_00982 [Propionibacterium sp. oral taxon 192 str. F0372]|uniref:hypothetical protein n=1 Tax=Propionibacterium sp. oral taxon 192 TaxID=671222 RepID=UPI000353F7F8|nr:hypothetical protein [Propionibacterium sp. oral taxon 192]EPH05553.1 hypothetical protein HMPREF1531_00982 [Propionibacterium sp. oral taxon 192 str. F0372]
MNRRQFDVMMVLAGAPYSDDSLGTALRTVEQLLARDASVHVWACGFATWLTQVGEPVKPAGALDWEFSFPSASGVVLEMINEYPKSLLWTACRTCSMERRLTNHAAPVRMRLATQMRRYFDAADKLISVGVV